jgi:hypothetical protein
MYNCFFIYQQVEIVVCKGVHHSASSAKWKTSLDVLHREYRQGNAHIHLETVVDDYKFLAEVQSGSGADYSNH